MGNLQKQNIQHFNVLSRTTYFEIATTENRSMMKDIKSRTIFNKYQLPLLVTEKTLL